MNHRLPLVAALLLACATSIPRQTFREGTGRTIVMLGGGTFGAAMFASHARELSHDFDVVRVQMLNVQTAESGTAMPRHYSVQDEASAVHDALLRLGITHPVDIAGASYGAVVALRFALAYPAAVRSITLFEPPSFWILPPDDFARDATLREMRDLTQTMTPTYTPTDEQFLRFRCILGICPPRIPAMNDPDRAEWDRGRLSMRGLSAIPRLREDPAALRRITVPVLLLTGDQTIPFHRRIVDRLAAAIPGARVVELHGGHSAPRTDKAGFIRALRNFLGR